MSMSEEIQEVTEGTESVGTLEVIEPKEQVGVVAVMTDSSPNSINSTKKGNSKRGRPAKKGNSGKGGKASKSSSHVTNAETGKRRVRRKPILEEKEFDNIMSEILADSGHDQEELNSVIYNFLDKNIAQLVRCRVPKTKTYKYLSKKYEVGSFNNFREIYSKVLKEKGLYQSKPKKISGKVSEPDDLHEEKSLDVQPEPNEIISVTLDAEKSIPAEVRTEIVPEVTAVSAEESPQNESYVVNHSGSPSDSILTEKRIGYVRKAFEEFKYDRDGIFYVTIFDLRKKFSGHWSPDYFEKIIQALIDKKLVTAISENLTQEQKDNLTEIDKQKFVVTRDGDFVQEISFLES